MSFFDSNIKISDIPCSVTTMGGINGLEYCVTFEREYASLEQIEAIDWRRPKTSSTCPLPKGYGFKVADIRYDMHRKSFTVHLQIKDQYLGDVTRYQAQIDALETDSAEKQGTIDQLKADSANKQETIQHLEVQLAEADETAIALYEELEAVQAQSPAEEPGQNGEVEA